MVFFSGTHHGRTGGQRRWRANRLRGLQIRIPCRARYVRLAHALSTNQPSKLSFPYVSSLGLDHLVGTPALKPYMHGYFLSLKLYDAARVIANPYVYEEHRAKMVQNKLDKLAEGRIRTRKDQVKVKVNKALAEKIAREEERAKKRDERKRKKVTEDGGDVAMDVDVDEDEAPAVKQKPSLLSDARFAALFEDPEFEVDEESREYALLNPSSVAQKKGRMPEAKGKGWGPGKTAVEDEEDESDKVSSDGLNDGEESSSGEDDEEHGTESEDSSEAGGMSMRLFLHHIHLETMDKHHTLSDLVQPRKPPPSARRTTNANLRLVPLQYQPSTSSGPGRTTASTDGSFGHRRSASARQRQRQNDVTSDTNRDDDEHVFRKGDGSVEVSWVPTTTSRPSRSDGAAGGEDDNDDLVERRPGGHKRASKDTRKGVERFGAGMEKGGENPDMRVLSEQERSGRTRRRRGMRSGSKNAFRQMQV